MSLCTSETQLPVSGNKGQLTAFPFTKMKPASLGVGLGEAAKEQRTPFLGATETEFTLPSAFSPGEESVVTVLSFFAKFGLYQLLAGFRQQRLVACMASWL